MTLSQQDFINRASLKHNNFYNYSKTIYATIKNIVTIICPIHGEFNQTPDHHIRGAGCIDCGGNKRLTNAIFIQKSNLKHNNFYDYSLVNYINNGTLVKIICPIHKEFEQKPANHMAGANCPSCTRNKKITQDEFIQISNLKHNNFYDYSEIIYNNKFNIKIICPIHGGFNQTAKNHMDGHGCNNCFKDRRKIEHLNAFIIKANIVHNNYYDYSKSDYNENKIKIICPLHGEFLQTSKNHLRGDRCSSCTKNKKITTEIFIKRACILFNNHYDYSQVIYKGFDKKLKIICPIHGLFEQKASKHLIGQGCLQCGLIKSKLSQKVTTEDFIKKANKIHDNKYNYLIAKYLTAKEKVEIICFKHGNFWQSPDSHLRGAGCPACGKGINISKAEINWLDSLNIHKENRHKTIYIKNKRIIVDAYDSKNNTIYEYYGDYWHGNPKVYKSEDVNKANKKTFGYLYEATIKRENLIKDNGYNLVSIWENDYDQLQITNNK